jgi:predicted SAM-dependent methyltransferase
MIKAPIKWLIAGWTIVRAAMSPPAKVEIGAGAVRGRNGWTTLDLALRADLYWDLRWGLPFRSESLEAVYSSHVMEHFAYPDLMKLLAEIRRVLKPGGVYSAAVPDAARYIDAYVNRGERPRCGWKPALRSELPIDLVNYVAYMDGQHHYMFDMENLQHVLRLAGFREVHSRAFDPALDRAERDYASIYAVAVK